MNELTAADLLRELQEAGETSRIEAKRGSEAGKSILETVCAFANEPGLGGGYLLLGVERVSELFGTRYVAVGIPNAEKVQEDLASQVNTVFNRRVRLQMYPEMIDEQTVVRVFVAEAPAGEKPIYFRSRGLPGGAYRRDGPTDVSCVEDDLLTLYQGRSQAPFDAGPVPGATWDDLSLEALEDLPARTPHHGPQRCGANLCAARAGPDP